MTRAGTVPEVFLAFLRLGVTSFGGPIAHLGYFRADLVVRRKWMDDRAYADPRANSCTNRDPRRGEHRANGSAVKRCAAACG